MVETELESVHHCQPGNVHVLASLAYRQGLEPRWEFHIRPLQYRLPAFSIKPSRMCNCNIESLQWPFHCLIHLIVCATRHRKQLLYYYSREGNPVFSATGTGTSPVLISVTLMLCNNLELSTVNLTFTKHSCAMTQSVV